MNSHINLNGDFEKLNRKYIFIFLQNYKIYNYNIITLSMHPYFLIFIIYAPLSSYLIFYDLYSKNILFHLYINYFIEAFLIKFHLDKLGSTVKLLT